MSAPAHDSTSFAAGGPAFASTHWSVVLAARQGDTPEASKALENLCRTYWYPVYAFARRRGATVEDAQDLTQEFFARLFLRDLLRHADREKGRFRTFLLASVQNFLGQQWHRHQAAKRGGGQVVLSWEELQAEDRYTHEPTTDLTPEALFEQRWALSVVEQTTTRLENEFRAAHKAEQFTRLKPFLSAEGKGTEYGQIGQQLGMTRDAVAVAVHRLRRRFGELLRAVVADTVASLDQVEDELRLVAQTLRTVSTSGG